ncbi:universal stress protein [Streptomyces sp. NPDC101118]|uniref:universal stress protein n=1 Tax=Streptomyces sp. NPDC101118 TaxID=3366109 RepID=UPI0038207747
MTTRGITAGVDGSPESLAAADWAADEAARRGTSLRLLHAWRWEPLDLPLVQNPETEAERARVLLEAALARVRARRPELAVAATVVPEHAVPALLRESRDAELLVLGSRGHGAVLGFLLGSYGQQVIAEAHCPVVSVRRPAGSEAHMNHLPDHATPGRGGPHRDASGGKGPDGVASGVEGPGGVASGVEGPGGKVSGTEGPGRHAPGGEEFRPGADGEVVVGVQGGADESADVLRFAFQAARARGSRLRAVWAWSLPPLYAYSPGSLALADEAGGLEPYERKALGTVLAPWRERFPEVQVTEHVEIGSAGQVLLSASGRASLLVVGRRVRRTPVGPRIGSTAHAALHHAHCPVAVIPHT